ncbi:hypothetical protein V8G54_019278 [Vigna mungo]|uniref:Uncharacterized protein n=1 Tax=Vigna mungo TaxID=3915 RepID=A0AAQ3NB63_VIGMU
MSDHVTSPASSTPLSFFFTRETKSQGFSSPPSNGIKLRLLTNHLRVNVGNIDDHFFQYSVSLLYKDGRLFKDGEKTIFTLGCLARNSLEFTVILEDVVSVGRNNENANPDRHREISENDKKRMRSPLLKLPCINVGKLKRPTYIPLKLCSLVSLQCYTKALTTLQRSSLVEKTRQKDAREDESVGRC